MSSQLARCAGGCAGWRLSGGRCCTLPTASDSMPGVDAHAQLPLEFMDRDRPQRAGMAPYPGQARCLALGFWPECFRRLDVKGGRRTFPKETRSALDIEGKHVTIQGPSPDLSPASALAPSACATCPAE